MSGSSFGRSITGISFVFGALSALFPLSAAAQAVPASAGKLMTGLGQDAESRRFLARIIRDVEGPPAEGEVAPEPNRVEETLPDLAGSGERPRHPVDQRVTRPTGHPEPMVNSLDPAIKNSPAFVSISNTLYNTPRKPVVEHECTISERIDRKALAAYEFDKGKQRIAFNMNLKLRESTDSVGSNKITTSVQYLWYFEGVPPDVERRLKCTDPDSNWKGWVGTTYSLYENRDKFSLKQELRKEAKAIDAKFGLDLGKQLIQGVVRAMGEDDKLFKSPVPPGVFVLKQPPVPSIRTGKERPDLVLQAPSVDVMPSPGH